MLGRISKVLRALCSLAITAALLAACGEARKHPVLPAATTVLALGDSLTYGTGASEETSYPSVLAALSGWNVVNAGIPGQTATEGCARLPALIDEHHPRLVLVLLGGNDFLRRLPEQGIKDALASCVESARARDLPLALIPVPRFGVGGLANAALYAEVSRELNLPLVDAGLADLLGRSSMCADRVHLNADGYRAMAETVAQGLRKQGFLKR